MRRWMTGLAVLAAVAMLQVRCQPKKPSDEGPKGNPSVVIETNFGRIEAELWPDRAPKTVANFLKYVDEGYYDGLYFHRVIKDFMIQGGGFTIRKDAGGLTLQERTPTHPEIQNEATKANRNLAGTLAMARTGDPHSASSQFYINLKDNAQLDHTAPTQRGWGYCVFGQVTRGMSVVEAIAKVRVHNIKDERGQVLHEAVPLQPVIIKSIRRLK